MDQQDMLAGGPCAVELECPGWAFVAEEVEFYNVTILWRIYHNIPRVHPHTMAGIQNFQAH